MKKYLIACMILAINAISLRAQDVNQILRKHELAMDGWDKVKTLKLKYQYGDGSIMTCIIEPGKAMKYDLNFGSVINHQAAIAVSNDWVRFLTWPDKADSIKMDGMCVFWPQFDMMTTQLLGCKAAGTRVEYVGVESVNETPCFKLKCTDKKGHETANFIDTATYFLVRTECVVNVKDQDRDAAVTYNNYTKTNEGIMFPMSITTNNGEMVFEKIEINVPVADSIFRAGPPGN